MIRAGAGISGAPDSPTAAKAAVGAAMSSAGLERASLLLLFVTAEHLPNWPGVAAAAAECAGGARVVGCTGYGVLTAGEEIEGTPGIAALALGEEGLPAAPFLTGDLREDPAECGREAGRQARDVLGDALDSDGPPLAVILPDSYNLQAKPFFAGLHETLGPEAVIVGGGASENGALGRTFQFLDKRIETNAVSGVVFAGGAARFIGISQAYQPVGEARMITRAEENLIYEISGRPAFEAFAKAAGPELMENHRRAAMSLFLGFPGDPDRTVLDHGNYIVRPVVGLDPESGAIALAEAAVVGQPVTFTRREGGRARTDLENMLDKGMARLADAAFGLYFNCTGRGISLYGEKGVDAEAIRRRVGGLPVVGFFTGAEFAPIGPIDHLHQYSGVLVLLGERGSP
ncbi:MAG: FIST N-terminal domain-containing protein [bacterium]